MPKELSSRDAAMAATGAAVSDLSSKMAAAADSAAQDITAFGAAQSDSWCHAHSCARAAAIESCSSVEAGKMAVGEMESAVTAASDQAQLFWQRVTEEQSVVLATVGWAANTAKESSALAVDANCSLGCCMALRCSTKASSAPAASFSTALTALSFAASPLLSTA